LAAGAAAALAGGGANVGAAVGSIPEGAWARGKPSAATVVAIPAVPHL